MREPEYTELAGYIGREVWLHGSVHKIRRMSGFVFCLLRTARYIVQCVCDRQELMERLMEEACIRLRAQVVKEERARAGFELHILDVEVLSRPAASMPVVINQKRIEASLENKLDYRPLTLRNEKERAIFRIQEGIARGFRKFFEEEHFVEIHTPKIVYAGAEGGANIFKLDYFGKEAFLAQSPQFYKQMMVGVFERVYEVGPVFRAEKHDTARHLNEYTGVDFEMGYIESFQDIMSMEVEMLQSAFRMLEEEYGHELELLEVRMPKMMSEEACPPEGCLVIRGKSAAWEADAVGIPCIKFARAKELVAAERKKEVRECHDFEPEEEVVLSKIAKRLWGSDFVFVTHYPAEKRPFYVMEETDCVGGAEQGRETLSFDLIFRGLEITTGGQRIHDYEMQLEKMKRRGMNVEDFESYLMMHRHGMPPHGGLGLGLERFTARLLMLENVRQAALFPRDIHRLTP